MILTKNVANAVGGKTARACDSCIKKRARWYCAADDAFLCQACDGSVHSANPLARRHARVRLKTASGLIKNQSCTPTWHHGFTKKARTPRSGNKGRKDDNHNPIPLVPELGIDEISHEENEEEHLLYRVPIFDPYVAEPSNESVMGVEVGDVSKVVVSGSGYGEGESVLHGFLPSDMDLAEFAADVESLLGRGLENGSFGMEELGLMDCREDKETNKEWSLGVNDQSLVKTEEENEGTNFEGAIRECHMGNEPFELSFDYDSPTTCGDEEEEKAVKGVVDKEDRSSASCREEADGSKNKKKKKKKNKVFLRLDYESVITAWASQNSSWTTGERPDFDPDESWPEFMGIKGAEVHQPYGEMMGMLGHHGMGDGGREARVSRYREKRRTRLFSKKIRYEVRKLNAEKRPRMKGRFVKRTAFAGPGFPNLFK